jgi:hypothetical protein
LYRDVSLNIENHIFYLWLPDEVIFVKESVFWLPHFTNKFSHLYQ